MPRLTAARILYIVIALLLGAQVGLWVLWESGREMFDWIRPPNSQGMTRDEKFAVGMVVLTVGEGVALAIAGINRARERARAWHVGKIVIIWIVSLLVGGLGLAIMADDPWDVGFNPSPLDGLTIGTVIAVLICSAIVPISLTWVWLGGMDRSAGQRGAPSSDSSAPVA